MNTMGKILVICNLLIACAVLGFILVDFSTRTNWKARHEATEVALKNTSAARESEYRRNQVREESPDSPFEAAPSPGGAPATDSAVALSPVFSPVSSSPTARRSSS